MDMKLATKTVAQTTSQYIGETVSKVAGYFLLGGAYALVTAGPILLTAAVCAISTLFDRIISGMLRDLVNKNIISVKTFSMLHNTVNVLSCTALIITGIYLNILGPVAIACIALNIIMSLGDFNAALKTPPPAQQPQQPLQPPQPAPALPVPQPQLQYVPPATQIPPQYLPPLNPNQPPPPYEPTLASSAPYAPSAPTYAAIWNKLDEGRVRKFNSKEVIDYASQTLIYASSAPTPQSPNTQFLVKLTTYAAQIATAHALLDERSIGMTKDQRGERLSCACYAAIVASQTAEMAINPNFADLEKIMAILEKLIELQLIIIKHREYDESKKMVAKEDLHQLNLMKNSTEVQNMLLESLKLPETS